MAVSALGMAVAFLMTMLTTVAALLALAAATGTAVLVALRRTRWAGRAARPSSGEPLKVR
ncbi:hypothetical protein [Kitasatospora sp. NPDC001095]